jgi:hypothetical protein
VKGCAGGCLERVLALVVLAILVIVAWRFGPDLWDRMASDPPPAAEEPSPELADLALERFQTLTDGGGGSASFSGPELESILRYRAHDWIPPGVGDPSVGISDGELRVGARVALDLLPRIPEIENLRSMLPDSVPVQLRGHVLSVEGEGTAFLIRRIDVAGIPIPRRLHADIARALDPRVGGGLPDEALRIPLPEGIRSAHLEDDRLRVVASP